MLLDGQFVVVICLECTSILARAVIQVAMVLTKLCHTDQARCARSVIPEPNCFLQ